MLGVLNPPNRRIRSRMYGGEGGAESRDSPLSRLTAFRRGGYPTVGETFQSTTKRSSNWIASCALAACQKIGGLFQRAWTLRSTSQINLIAASSLGKCPR